MRLRLAAVVLGFLPGIALAQATAPPSWGFGSWTRPVSAPVLTPDTASTFLDPITHVPVHWEALHTFNPAAVVRDGKIAVLYRAEDNSGKQEIGGHTSRLGLATTTDGIHFTRLPAPVFFPADDAQKSREWPGGVEDPRLVEAPDGTYVLTYTQWNRATYSIGIASSPDLLHWTKHGPAFLGSADSRYDTLRYKSGAILTELSRSGPSAGRVVAARVNGRFWMYWGEGAIHLATSPDLIHWTPVETAPGHPLELLRPRPGHFDSSFPEAGPPPLLTGQGIVLLYNGKNAPTGGDPALGPNAYATGEALFSAQDPSRLIAQRPAPVLKPEQPFEKTGQYAAGTTFAEGLVHFGNRWWLFYGCADSDVGVVATPEASSAREGSTP